MNFCRSSSGAMISIQTEKLTDVTWTQGVGGSHQTVIQFSKVMHCNLDSIVLHYILCEASYAHNKVQLVVVRHWGQDVLCAGVSSSTAL